MQNKKIIIAIALLVYFLTGCKKNDPEVHPAGPTVFSFNGNINGTPISIVSGVNNYYMNTSYLLDGYGVYEYTGELKDKNCTGNCTSSLKITFKDYRQYYIAPTSVDSAITPGFYTFAMPSGSAAKYAVTFNPSFNKGVAQSYLWNFGDGSPTSTTINPTHYYLHPGIYSVSLYVQSTTLCSSTIANDVVVGQVGNAFQAAFSPSVSGNTLAFYTSTAGVVPVNNVWNFGDGTPVLPATITPSVIHTYSVSGVYQPTLSATDFTGYTAIRRMNVSTQGPTSCFANYYDIVNSVNSPYNLAGVIIEWRDAGGTLYTSLNDGQLKKSYFNIISVENYINNANGQATKKIHAKISCTLYNLTNTSSVVMDNAEIVFAVGHL